MRTLYVANPDAIARLSAFEGSEAIFLTRSAVLVRVSNIRTNLSELSLTLQVDEIETAGLPVGFYGELREERGKAVRGLVRTGALTRVSTDTLTNYSSCSFHFSSSLIEQVVELSSRFSDELSHSGRLREIRRLIWEHGEFGGVAAPLFINTASVRSIPFSSSEARRKG